MSHQHQDGAGDGTAEPSTVSRRSLLRFTFVGGGALLAGGALAACGSTPDAAGSSSTPPAGSTQAPASSTAGGASGSGSGSAPAPSGKQTLTASHPQEPPDWNYLNTSGSALMVPIYTNVMESLFTTGKDSTLVPCLAEKFDVSADGLTYTITLRKAKFHNGADFTSEDAVYSLKTNQGAANSSVKTPLQDAESIEAPDASTVVVKLKQPSREFRAGLGTVATLMAPKGYFEGPDVGKKLTGTGPYTFDAYRPGVDLTLKKFDGYWGDAAHIATVTHRFMTDETATINALRTGDLDMIGMLFGDGLDQVNALKDDKQFQVWFTAATEISHLFLSPKFDAFKDDRVRQAIAHAIDRKPIIDAAVGGFAEPTALYITPWTVPWNSDYNPYPYDPDKAKSLLKDAGVDGTLKFDFEYLTIAEFPASFQVVQQQLAAVGITVDGKGMDLATWLQKVYKDHQFTMSHITTSQSLFGLSCQGTVPPLGGSGTCDAEYQGYVEKNNAILDDAEYVKAMKVMVNRWSDLAWSVPLFAKTAPGAASAKLTGIPDFRMQLGLPYAKISWIA